MDEHNGVLLVMLGGCEALDIHVAREVVAIGRGLDVEGLGAVGDSVEAEGRLVETLDGACLGSWTGLSLGLGYYRGRGTGTGSGSGRARSGRGCVGWRALGAGCCPFLVCHAGGCFEWDLGEG